VAWQHRAAWHGAWREAGACCACTYQARDFLGQVNELLRDGLLSLLTDVLVGDELRELRVDLLREPIAQDGLLARWEEGGVDHEQEGLHLRLLVLLRNRRRLQRLHLHLQVHDRLAERRILLADVAHFLGIRAGCLRRRRVVAFAVGTFKHCRSRRAGRRVTASGCGRDVLHRGELTGGARRDATNLPASR
jgi:hypothetical protein